MQYETGCEKLDDGNEKRCVTDNAFGILFLICYETDLGIVGHVNI